MSSALLDELRRKFGVFYKAGSKAGDATHESLLPAIRHRDRDGTEVACPNSEWILSRAVVHLSAAGTSVSTDASSGWHQSVNVAANTPTPIEGPISGGLGKAIAYTTTGGGNSKIDSWWVERRYTASKPAGAVGS